MRPIINVFFSSISAQIELHDYFSQMNFDERLGYLFGLMHAFREEAISVLNDVNKPDIAKFLYCLIFAESVAKTFENVLELLFIGAGLR